MLQIVVRSINNLPATKLCVVVHRDMVTLKTISLMKMECTTYRVVIISVHIIISLGIILQLVRSSPKF